MLLRNKASNRGSEIPESNYGSETDAARAAPFRRVRTRPTGSASCGCTRPIPVAGPVTGTGASWRVYLKLWPGSDPKSTGIAAARWLRPEPGQHGRSAQAGRAGPGHGTGWPGPVRRLPSLRLQGMAQAGRGGPATLLAASSTTARACVYWQWEDPSTSCPVVPCLPVTAMAVGSLRATVADRPGSEHRRSARPRSSAARARASCTSDARSSNGRAAHHAACSTPR